jgi:chromosome segregation ATPase
MSVEVTMLREEVRRLQAALLERFRGNSKFVSGGQFRGYAKAQKEPEKCAGCANMRGTVKRVRGELRDLRAHCEDSDRKLSEAASEKHRLETQLQNSQANHADAMSKLMEKLQIACKGEEHQAAIVQQLRAELATLKSKKTGDEKCNSGQEELQKQRDLLLQQLAASKAAARRVQELEAELRKFQTHSQELEAKYRRVNHQLQEARAEGGLSKEQLQEAEKRILELEQECASMALQLQALRKQKSSDDVEIVELRRKFSTCEDEKVQVVLKLGQLKGQLNAKEASVNKAQNACLSLKSDLKALQEKYESLKKQYEGKCGELKASQDDILALQEQIALLKKRVAELEAQLAQMRSDHGKKQAEADSKVHQNDFNDLQSELARVMRELAEMTAKRAAMQENIDKLGVTVEELTAKVASQGGELEAQKKELEEVMARAKEQQRLQAKALETAMQSLVRLCVVAPTVNVHLGDQTMGCKAPLPQVR